MGGASLEHNLRVGMVDLVKMLMIVGLYVKVSGVAVLPETRIRAPWDAARRVRTELVSRPSGEF
eukprot:1158772-Amphidinium_carterae.1